MIMETDMESSGSLEMMKRLRMECEMRVDRTIPKINEIIEQFDERENPRFITQSIYDVRENIDRIRDYCHMNVYEYENVLRLLQHAVNFIKLNRKLAYDDIINVKQNILRLKSSQRLLHIL
jgi:hypothetical protein